MRLSGSNKKRFRQSLFKQEAMKINYAIITKTGKRSNNEDAVKVIQPDDKSRWTGIVCDGMGGHAMGETASQTVAESIAEYWIDTETAPDTEEKVIKACKKAGVALNEKARIFSNAEMGTTMVMASLDGDTLTVAHIGDSRCYLQRPGEGVLCRTADHIGLSFGWEIVTKCFFSFKPEIAVPETVQFKVKSGDRILLCTDGVYKSMPPEILTARMMDEKSPEDILDVLDFLCEKNGDDNYTAILAVIE